MALIAFAHGLPMLLFRRNLAAVTAAIHSLVADLPPNRLRKLTRTLQLEVADRRSKDALVGAVAGANFLAVAAELTLPELTAVCARLRLPTKGNKAELVGRIARSADTTTQSNAPFSGAMSTSEAGAVKTALRKLALEAPRFGPRDAARSFVEGLLAAFGYPANSLPDLKMPTPISIVDGATRTTRNVATLWPERRVLVDVVDVGVVLDRAWPELLRACLQVDPLPQYVVLTNRRDLHLYDLAHDRHAPRLSLALDELAKQTEAFPFLSPDWTPGATPKIVNSLKVSREVADLVAKLYRSMKAQYPKREREVIQFTLQCIITMFAEDIGLLPREHFTSLLYEGARRGDVEARLREMFRVMSTKNVPEPRPVAFFNGGLFKEPVTLALGEAQLAALTRAAESHWKYVDPHIFGSVFQGIMDDEERHASGAHYTAIEDIMRVVGPTIVEPWRKKIGEAKTLERLLVLRDELFKFRVLDPACGSGNFLYVAFRELYRLDTELLGRIREFSSKSKVRWSLGIPTTNFYGIDINPFAVELAKVTLNIAKKIAFEERKASALAANGQLGFEVDPSLPLDNLDANIRCADALFTEWPAVEAIVGNPPMLGDRKMRKALGADYLTKLQRTSGVDGVVDLSCYWFRNAHDRLRAGQRAGLVGTSGIRVGKAREASLDYIVTNGGTITNAVSSIEWPGEAALNVSMVNWVKAPVEGPHVLIVDGAALNVARIATHLQLHHDASQARALAANSRGAMVGLTLASGDLIVPGTSNVAADTRLCNDGVVREFVTGTMLLTAEGPPRDERIIFLGDCETEAEAKRRGGAAFRYLEKGHLQTVRSAKGYDGWLERWWQPWRPRPEFFAAAKRCGRYIATSKVQARPIFMFVSSRFVPNDTLQLFMFDDDYSFGILQSTLHWDWLLATGGKVRQDIRYTSRVWETFPWPQEVPEEAVVAVARAGRELRATRERLMAENGWSLRALHQAADVDGPHPLKDARRTLDDAVADAYGVPGGQDTTEFLLELNRCLVEDEAEGRAVTGPGLPSGFDPKDSRWMSDDCIRPPSKSEEARRASQGR